MGISPINSYNHISFTSQKKPKKVVRIPCKVKKQPETNNSIRQTKQQTPQRKSERPSDLPMGCRRVRHSFLDNIAGGIYMFMPFIILPLMLAAENEEQKALKEQQPTHSYSETQQYEGIISDETLPIVLETTPDETFEIVPQETTQDEIYTTIPQEAIIEETIAASIQEKEENNTLDINGVSIVFDFGTLHKKDADTFYGLIDGAYCVVSRNKYGNVTVEKHEDIASDSNLSKITKYNSDGLIVEIDDYTDGILNTVKKYSYTKNSKIETKRICTASYSNEIDKIITTYNIKNDEVTSKEFQADNKIVATFDFSTDTVIIGSEKNQELDATMFLLLRIPLMKGGETHVFDLDYGSLKNDESTVNSNRYTATLNGDKVVFDVLEDGICIEYLDNNNSVIKSEKYNTKAELVR